MMKAYAAGFCAAVVATTALAVSSADAATKKRYGYTTTRVASAERPRARIRVEPRSFLDAGTEVLPGERKFLDYAFPPGTASMPYGNVTSTGGRVGWHQSPLPGPFDLPSRNNPFGW